MDLHVFPIPIPLPPKLNIKVAIVFDIIESLYVEFSYIKKKKNQNTKTQTPDKDFLDSSDWKKKKIDSDTTSISAEEMISNPTRQFLKTLRLQRGRGIMATSLWLLFSPQGSSWPVHCFKSLVIWVTSSASLGWGIKWLSLHWNTWWSHCQDYYEMVVEKIYTEKKNLNAPP